MLEHRVSSLELRMERVETSLQRIEIVVAETNERTKHLSTSAEVNLIKGRIENIPTTWQTVSILGILMVGVIGAGVSIASIIRATQKSPPAITAPAAK